MKIRSALPVLLSCACLVACGWSKKQINGQIFITSDDGNAIRLSLTDIHVLNRATAMKLLHQLHQHRDEATTTLRQLRQRAEEQLKTFTESTLPRINEAQHLWQLFERAEERMRTSTTIMKAITSEHQAGKSVSVKTLTDAIKESDQAREDYMKAMKAIPHVSKDQIKQDLGVGEEMKQIVNSLKDREREAQNLSAYAESKDIPAISKAMANLDGKFTIDISRKDVVLFAVSSREIKGQMRRFCWLVKPSPKHRLIMLTNRNTIDSSAPENFAAHQ